MAPAKQKSQKMSLGDFLGDQSLGSWADEMEDMPVASDTRTGYGDRRSFTHTAGFGGDRGFGGREDHRGGYHREQLPLPTKPPYTAHLGNLAFDATEGDIHDFFHDCEVTSVRIVEDKIEKKPKGFGYVEFGTLEGLKKALTLNLQQFQGRQIRISVADPPRERQDVRELDWTRKGPPQDLPAGGRRASARDGFRGYNQDAASDAGSERGGRRRPFESDGKARDLGNWERKGPLSPLPPTEPMRDGGRVRGRDGPRERRNSPSWGEGRSQDGSRPPRREFHEKPHYERQPTASELDNQWRARMRPDAPPKSPQPSPGTSTPGSPAAAPATLAVRPKLNLAKRTVSEAEPSPASSSDSGKPNPFGGAQPVDTASREREIEEKRQLTLRLKKEHDEKSREEKRHKEFVGKAEKTASHESPKASHTEGDENGSGEPGPRPHFEVLRRAEGEEGEGSAGVPANGTMVEDRAVKPKEHAKDVPKHSTEGSWRRKSSTPAAPAEPASERLEEEGWSTVTKPRGGRRGGGSRAIAS